jgi:hypothetical protein
MQSKARIRRIITILGLLITVSLTGAKGRGHPVDRTASGHLSPRGFLGRSSQPTTVPVKLPVFCLAACVQMRYFTCAHQPTLTGAVMWWSRLSPTYWHLRVREEWGQNHGEPLSRCHGRHQSGWRRSFDPVR